MKAFTLVEIILSMAIIAVIFAFTAPFFQILQNRNDLEVAANTVVQSYGRAQILAQAVDGDASWGVKVQSGQITIFKGNDYAGRDQSLDENYDIPTGMRAAGATETVFAKFTGLPLAAAALTLTSTNNETRTITLNEKGIADY